LYPSTRALLTRLLRAYIRYFPLATAKQALWTRVVDPYFAWQRHEFVATTIFGSKLEGDTRDILQQYVYYFGVWEPHLTKWIARRIRRGDIFVDVGANVGYFTLLAATLVGQSGTVVAVEPSPRLFAMLRKGILRNRVKNVRALNLAVLDHSGTVPLYRGTEHHSGLTTTRAERGLDLECEVEAAPLMAILLPEELENARLVKIDVEGAEWAVISGMEPLLRAGRPDLEIVVEIDPELLAHQRRRPEDLLQLFAEHGFHAYRVENDYSAESYIASRGRELPPRRLRGPIEGVSDVIFSREDAEVI
jgi:FkbM family methyltransferase